ncbi:hypothetical protein N806_24995 [Rhodococcus sp. P27]|nr:hypothetical protein N806_24995 [Rhodococcus sp. P27]
MRAISGVTYVSLADADGSVVISTRPGDVGVDARQTQDRSWTGLVDTSSGKAVEAHVPILGSEGGITGTAIVGIEYPSIWTRLLQSAPNLLVYLAVASLLGGVGSILLARRSNGRPSAWRPARSWTWFANVRRCCVASRKVSSHSTRRQKWC